MTTTDAAALASLQALVEALANRVGEVADGATELRRHVRHQSERIAALEAAHFASPVDTLESQLREARAECERIKRQLQFRDETNQRLADECERQRQWIAGLDAGLCDDSIAKQTVAAIADHLEQRAQAILDGSDDTHGTQREREHRAAGLTDAVDALRAGTWRTK